MEDAEAVRAAIARSLPPGQRRVVVLRHISNLTIEETAAELGISTGTVKSQSADAVAALRRALAPTFGAALGQGERTMNNELDVMRRLVDYHDHIAAPQVPLADDLRRGRRRVRRNRGLLVGGVAVGLASVVAVVSLVTGDRAADRPHPAGQTGLTTPLVAPRSLSTSARPASTSSRPRASR